MTPGARAQAAIDLLDLIADRAAAARPADKVVSGYFRARRYAGAKDRNAIAGAVYGVLRRRAGLDWWIDRTGHGDGGRSRARMLAQLALIEGWNAPAIAAAFDGGRHRPSPLSERESHMVSALEGRAVDDPAQPRWVRGNYPEWQDAGLAEVFGDDLEVEMAALGGRAPVDLRVNGLKATRSEAAAALAAEGVTALPTPWSPVGLRLEGRWTLPALAAFRDGLVEVQDEGAQIVALLVGAGPGEAVLDFCAGAGGKTLALAAAMENKGRLVAADVSEARLRAMAPRLKRAGVTIVESRVLADNGANGLAPGGFDRVLVDAPCSGSGTWRRNPDAKWRLEPAELETRIAEQRQILARAAEFVRPRGRLVYATCSLLADENERQVARFLADRHDFRSVPLAEAWREAVGGACPAQGHELVLTPHCHGTDGFFAAVLERRP